MSEVKEEKVDQTNSPSGLTEQEIEAKMLEDMDAGGDDAGADASPDISALQFDNLQSSGLSGAAEGRIDLIMDIVLPVSIELGRTKMFVKDVLELERGSIIELDKMAGEPVDLYINNKKMAEGEVVVVDKHFGIRITNLIDPKDRIKNLGKEF